MSLVKDQHISQMFCLFVCCSFKDAFNLNISKIFPAVRQFLNVRVCSTFPPVLTQAVNIAISVTALKVHLLSAQCSFMMQEHREVGDLKVAAFAVTTTRFY